MFFDKMEKTILIQFVIEWRDRKYDRISME